MYITVAIELFRAVHFYSLCLILIAPSSATLIYCSNPLAEVERIFQIKSFKF